MIAFIFPGQGSQQLGMGRDLFDRVPEFTAIEQQANDLLGFSVRQMCLENPGNQLGRTQYTQPCLFVVNALHYYTAVEQPAGSPHYVAGHSLGEYNALHAAGAFDLMTGLGLVMKRGSLMAHVSGGGMAAVMGLSADRIELLLHEERLTLDIANYNSPSQTIVSGRSEDIDRASSLFERAGAMFIRLPVSGAFHSHYMSEPARTFSNFLNDIAFGPLRIPVVSNVTGTPYPATDPSHVIREHLVRQFTEPVQWVKCVRYLRKQVGSWPMEVGPGNVLTKLTRQIEQEL